MGKPKTQRTEDLHKAARRYVVGKQVEQAIEQHNFDRLIEQGVIVRGVEALKGEKHRVFDEAIIESLGGLSSKVPKPPEGRGLL